MTDQKQNATDQTPEVIVEADRLSELLASYPGIPDYPVPSIDDLFIPAPVTPGRKNAAERNSATTGKNIEAHLTELAAWRDTVATFFEERRKTDVRQRNLITDLRSGNQNAWNDRMRLHKLLRETDRLLNQQADNAAELQRIYGACDLVFAAAMMDFVLLTGVAVKPGQIERIELPDSLLFKFEDGIGCTHELNARESDSYLVSGRYGFNARKFLVDAEGILPESWLALAVWLKYAKNSDVTLLEHLPQRVHDYLHATPPDEETTQTEVMTTNQNAVVVFLRYVDFSSSGWRFR